jgi:uncharacterized protein (TIGR02145 family)
MKRSDWEQTKKQQHFQPPKWVEGVKRNRIINNITKFLLNMKQKMIYLALTLLVWSAASVKSQVLIGGNENDDPHKGAVLDLSQTANLGLLLPQVFLTNVSDWQLDGNTEKEGMLIYNTNDDVPNGNGKDIYVWTRNSWKPVGPVTLKRFELDKNPLFLDTDGETGIITAQNFISSDDQPFGGVTVSWSIVAGAVPGDVSTSDVDNTFTVISGSTAGSFTVRATANGITQDCVVTIVDCPNAMEDIEENEYTVGWFGSAGCWMTQNLRTKTYADGITLTLGSNPDYTSKFYTYPDESETTFTTHEEYGLLYTWAAATNRAATSANETNSSSQQQYQGICPTDWHLPSDYEWLQLEEEIAKSVADVYSATGPTTWETSYSSTLNATRGQHGRKMKSTTAVNSINPNGTSNAHTANGFDALLVGYVEAGVFGGYGTASSFVSSSSVNLESNVRFICYDNSAGVNRSAQPKRNMRSVRCKKN